MIVWHASREPLTEIRPGLHVGTRAQAEMRGGILHAIRLDVEPTRRMRDHGENAWRAARLRQARRRGCRIVVYLNRFEGIPAEEFARHRPEIMDAMTDAAFRRAVPSCADSWIILDPSSATLLGPEA